MPAERHLRRWSTTLPCDEPVVRIPVPTLIALTDRGRRGRHRAGALDDLVALADHKVPLLASAPLAADPVFQVELAGADTDVRAARALLAATAEEVWATAVAGEPLTMPQRAQARATAVWVTDRAAAVVDGGLPRGGGTAVYRTSPLQRRLRDVHTLTQHFLVRRNTMTTAGAVLAGQDVDIPVF